MKFQEVSKFMGSALGDILKYLRNADADFRSLFVGLRHLNFRDNVDGFEWSGTITSGATVSITNPLGSIPTHRVILRVIPVQGIGTVIITDSLTAWTDTLVYLENVGTVDASIIAYFVR